MKLCHFVQKVKKNQLKDAIDTKKEAKRDANHKVLLWCRFNFVLDRKDDKFVEFVSMIQYCTRPVSYKTFWEFHRDIRQRNDKILQNGENFRYKHWHVDRNTFPPVNLDESNEEEEEIPNPHRDSTDHEWEILFGIYNNKVINYNEFKVIGHRDHDVIRSWSSNFVDANTSTHTIHFIY